MEDDREYVRVDRNLRMTVTSISRHLKTWIKTRKRMTYDKQIFGLNVKMMKKKKLICIAVGHRAIMFRLAVDGQAPRCLTKLLGKDGNHFVGMNVAQHAAALGVRLKSKTDLRSMFIIPRRKRMWCPFGCRLKRFNLKAPKKPNFNGRKLEKSMARETYLCFQIGRVLLNKPKEKTKN